MIRIDYDRVYRAIGTNRGEIDEICRLEYGSINRRLTNVRRRHELARKMRAMGLSLPQIRDGLGYSSHTHLLKETNGIPRGRLAGMYLK